MVIHYFTRFRIGLLVAVVLVSLVPKDGRAQSMVWVTGTVKGSNGIPIGKALVTVIPDCSGCITDVVESAFTNEAGEFRLSIISKKPQFLFVKNSISPLFWNVLPNPEDKLRYLRDYRGVRITMEKSRSINLGEMRPTVELFEATITPSEVLELAQLSDDDAIWIQMMDKEGRHIDEPRMVERKFIENGKTIKLAIPRGDWQIEFIAKKSNRIINRTHYRVRAVGVNDIVLTRLNGGCG